MADEKAFGAGHQQRIAAGLVDRLARGTYALDAGIELEQRPRRIAGGVFDGQSGDAAFHGETHAVGNSGGVRRKAVFEIGIDGKVGRLDQFGEVIEHSIARHGAVPMAM